MVLLIIVCYSMHVCLICDTLVHYSTSTYMCMCYTKDIHGALLVHCSRYTCAKGDHLHDGDPKRSLKRDQRLPCMVWCDISHP